TSSLSFTESLPVICKRYYRREIKWNTKVIFIAKYLFFKLKILSLMFYMNFRRSPLYYGIDRDFVKLKSYFYKDKASYMMYKPMYTKTKLSKITKRIPYSLVFFI